MWLYSLPDPRRTKTFFCVGYAVLIVVGGILSSWANAEDDIRITNAWVKLSPPGARVYAAYLDIENLTSRDYQIVAVSADCCKQVSLHETQLRDGSVSMIHREHLDVPAQSRLSLSPGGLHLMLAGVQSPLKLNDNLIIQLHFSDGQRMMVQAPVRRNGDD